jgi:DHA1 family multidrug resistance protein-like MFS transporter
MIWFVYLIVMVSFIDTFSQLPLMAPYAVELGAGSLLTGLIIGMYSFSNMWGNLYSGIKSDRTGRKKMLLLGMGIAAGSLLFYGAVSSPIQLLFIRLIHGVGGGLMIPAVFAYLGDRTESMNKGKAMALSGSAIGASAILGPAFGGFVKTWLGIEWVFYIISIIMIVTVVCIYYFLPEKYSVPKKNAAPERPLKELLLRPQLLTACISAFCLMFALGVVVYNLPLKVEQLGFSSAVSGILLATFGIVAVILFILPTNRISDRYGRKVPLFVGLFMISTALYLLGIFFNLWQLIGVMIVYGMGFSLLFPAMTALIIDHTDHENRGKGFGLFYAFFSLGVIIGPLYIGIWGVSPDRGLIIGSITLLCFVFVLLIRQFRWSK